MSTPPRTMLPQITELPRLGTFAFVSFAHVLCALVPSIFVSCCDPI